MVSIDRVYIIIFQHKSINLFNFARVSLSDHPVRMMNVFLFACVRVRCTVTEWEGEVLEIARISRLDMSAYLCIASNGVPPSVSKRIKVSVDCEYACLMTYLASFQTAKKHGQI